MPTKTKPLFKSFLLYSGAYEDQSIRALLVSHRVGFNTLQEAIISLARVFKESGRQQLGNAYKASCCEIMRENHPGSRYCGACGQSLLDDEREAGGAYEEYVSGDMDGSYFTFAALEAQGWTHDPDHFDWANRVEITSTEQRLNDCDSWASILAMPEVGRGNFTFANRSMENRFLINIV